MKNEFIVFHLLKTQGLSNVNSDMYGKPKTITFPGQAPRTRYSSQNVNQTIIREELKESGIPVSMNTCDIAHHIVMKLTEPRPTENGVQEGIDVDTAKRYAEILKMKVTPKKEKKAVVEEEEDIEEDVEETNEAENTEAAEAPEKGKGKKKKEKKEKEEKETNILVKFSSVEFQLINDLINRIRDGITPTDADFDIRRGVIDFDTMLFGSMDALHPERNVDAGWSQNHPFTVTESPAEVDQFCAKDDLRKSKGAAFLSNKHFSSGTFYISGIANIGLLTQNALRGKKDTPENRAKAREEVFSGLKIVLNALVKRTPPGRSTKMADSQSYADYVMIEKGPYLPRTHSAVFNDPISGNVLETAVERLRKAHFCRNAQEDEDVEFVEYKFGDTREVYKGLFEFLK